MEQVQSSKSGIVTVSGYARVACIFLFSQKTTLLGDLASAVGDWVWAALLAGGPALQTGPVPSFREAPEDR
jgi:hypothetical protein